MKILKKQKLNKILSLKLIKNTIFNKKQNKFNQTKLELKKQVKIIFKFFLFNKQILFLNVLNKLNQFMLTFIKNTKHCFLTNNTWFNGVLTNLSSIFKALILLKNVKIFIKFLFNLQKTNLIVIFNKKINVSELLNFKVPIVNFGYNGSPFYDYKLNYFFKNINNFFIYSLLNVIKLKVRLLIKKNSKF